MRRLRSLAHLAQPALRPPGNAASFADHDWKVEAGADRLWVGGGLTVTNLAGDREVMVCDVVPRVTLLSESDTARLTVRSDVRSRESSYPPRRDRYWTAYVVKPHGDTEIDVEVSVTGDGLADVYAVWVEIAFHTYGGEGLRPQYHHVVRAVDSGRARPVAAWREVGPGLAVLPVPTRLLAPGDDPAEVIRDAVGPHARPGDVVTLGETPLAVMQGRIRHPNTIHPGPMARHLCYLLGGEGSLGTAPGLQALVDEIGRGRVLTALAVGSWGKLRGRDGDFYRAAGPQARLIDDVTGTLPPYDRFLVLGPTRSEAVVEDIAAATGLGVAVVDANDLGAVDVVAASPGVPTDAVKDALRSNPAGNAAERTPVVLIRRSEGRP